MENVDWNGELERILGQLGADSGTIHTLQDDGHLHLAAAHGIPDAVVNLVRVVPVGKGMAGLAAERREPVSICNIQTDQSGDVRAGARATGLQGSVAVPMIAGNQLAGVLGVASRTERIFSEEEITRLLDNASRLANLASRP